MGRKAFHLVIESHQPFGVEIKERRKRAIENKELQLELCRIARLVQKTCIVGQIYAGHHWNEITGTAFTSIGFHAVDIEDAYLKVERFREEFKSLLIKDGRINPDEIVWTGNFGVDPDEEKGRAFYLESELIDKAEEDK